MLSSALILLLFPFTSGYLRPAVTRQCTKRVIVNVLILYSLYISLSLSFFAVYALIVRIVLSHYNFSLNLVFNSEEKENCDTIF